MPNQKVPQLPVLSAVTGEDLFYVVDVSDTTDDPTGSSKQISRDNILKNITGLTVNGDVNITGNTYVTGVTNTNGVTSTGGITFKQVTINSTYSATTQDYMIDVTGGTFSVYLPSAVGIQGRLLVVKNNGGGAVTVQPISGQDIDGKPFVVLGETNTIQLASNGTNWVAISYNISTVNSSTGVFEFSGISKVSSTQFSVAPVKGWVVDDTTNPLSPQLYFVSFTGGTYTDSYVTTAYETFLLLTTGGTITQTDVYPTDEQRRLNIFLGKIGHPEKTSINLVFSQPDFVLSPLSQLRDMFEPINLINGGIYPSPNGANLSFNTSAGYLHGLGINFVVDTLSPNSIYVSGTNPCTFQYRTQTGGTVTNVTTINPTVYDLNGVITALSGTKTTNQRIFLLQNGQFRVQYGQHFYSTFAEAVQAIQTETFTPFPNFINNAVLIGILTVSSSATDLTDTSKAQFFFASKFGETVGAAGGVSTTNLQQAYNNSSTPEITTNSTLGAVSIKNGAGTADNVTSLFETLNSGGTTTMFIRADGSISATTITATTVSATTISATTYYGSGTNLTGVVKGSGTTNYLPRWTGTTGLGDSIIRDDGTNIGIGTLPSTSAKILLVTTTNQYGVYFQNSNSATGSVGVFGRSNSGSGSQTGVRGEGQGHPTSGTSVGIEGWGTDGLVAIGVRGLVGPSEFGGVTTGIGGYFDSRGDGGYGYPTNSYGLQVIDGTEGINKVLISVTSDGKTNWSSSLSGLTTVRSTTISGGTVSGGTMVITTTPTTDNTNTQVLTRDPSTGTVELMDTSSIQVAFNYGLANAIMTGNYLT